MLLGLALSGLGGCRTRVDESYLAWAQMSWDAVEFSRLGPGDVIEIRVYRQPEMSAEYTVPSDGTVTFPLIGFVQVRDRSCEEIQEDITRRLGEEFLRNPSVSCRIQALNSLRVVVSGEVKTPGRFPYSDSLTVVEAIALAQGLTPSAASDRVVITRVIEGQATEIQVPLRAILAGRAPNFRLWPNDIVTVPSFRFIP